MDRTDELNRVDMVVIVFLVADWPGRYEKWSTDITIWQMVKLMADVINKHRCGDVIQSFKHKQRVNYER